MSESGAAGGQTTGAQTPETDLHRLELTVSALREGLPTLGLDGGLVEVCRWVDASRDAGLPQIADSLVELRGLLEGASSDAAAYRTVLTTLAEQTRAAAGGATDAAVADQLRQLADELQQAPGSLGGL